MLLCRLEELTEMLQELERKRAELMREVHAVSAAIKAYAETIGQPLRGPGIFDPLVGLVSGKI